MTVVAAHVAIARLRQLVGAPGLLGLALLAAATVTASLAWRQHHRLEQDTAAAALVAEPSSPIVPEVVRPRPSSVAHARMPPMSDASLILSRIERAAVAHGLGWPKADYRVEPAAEDRPSSLEVRCVLKGSYIAIRRFVGTVLGDAPTLTFREFSVARDSTESSVVEAKLTMVVYLASPPRDPRSP